MVSLDQLRALRAIANEGSISRAAETLHLSQPTLSHHIAALEATVGAPVLKRSTRGSVLTPLGETALLHAEAILDRSAAAERELRDQAAHGSTAVAAGSFPSAAAAILVPALAKTASAGVRHSLLIAEQPELLVELRRRELDVALLSYDPHPGNQPPEGVKLEPILEDPLVVLVPPDHPVAHRPEARLNDLVGDSLIMGASNDNSPAESLADAFRGAGRELHVAQRVDDYPVTEALVAAGMGVSLIPSIAISQLSGQAVVRRLVDTPLVRRIYVAWHDEPVSPAVTQVVDAVRATALQLQETAVR